MALNSIITNVGAQVALSSLNSINSQLAVAQKQISTGYRVADATDNGAAYAIAQRVRSDVGALNSANQQLGNVQGLLGTTSSALNDISNTLNSARDVLVKLADANTTGTQRTQYASQYQALTAQIRSFISDSSYNSKSLIGDIGGATINSVNVVRNESGGTYNIATFSGSALYNGITFSAQITSTTTTAAKSIAALITNGGSFIKQLNSVANALNKYGSETNYVNNQISYNSDKMNALSSGLGSLIDANLAKESAVLQSLQIQQQLATQSLTVANQAPQSLLKLYGL